MYSYQDKKNIYDSIEKILKLNNENKKKEFIKNLLEIFDHDKSNKTNIITKNNGYYIKFNALTDSTLEEINEYVSDIINNKYIIY